MAINTSLNTAITPISPAAGGTGVDNSTNTLTVSANSSIDQDVTTSGNPTFASLVFSPTTQGIVGVTDGSNAAAGYVGEYMQSVVLSGSAVPISTATATNLTQLSLTAGDWDVYGNINLLLTLSTPTQFDVWISLSSATLPNGALVFTNSTTLTGTGGVAPFFRASLATTTTVYLTGFAGFGVGTASMIGGLYARRVR